MLSRAKRAGVEAIVITGSSLRSTETAASLVRTHASPEHPQLYFTAGMHPHEAKSCDEATIPKLRQFLQNDRCVAVGECGLDFNRCMPIHSLPSLAPFICHGCQVAQLALSGSAQ